MYKYLISFLLSIIVAIELLQAQSEDNLKAVVTTIHGDEINGYIKLSSLPSRITLFYPTGDSLTLDSKVIQSMHLNKVSNIPISSVNNNGLRLGSPELRFFNNTLFGILTGKSDVDSPPQSFLSIETINGIILYKYLRMGVGIGYDRYNTTAVVPFFLSVRGDILAGSITPFYFIDAGLSTAWDSMENENNWNSLDTEGRFMYHLGMGVKVYSGNRINIMLALGYKYQKVVYNSVIWDGSLKVDNRRFNRLSLRLGIGF